MSRLWNDRLGRYGLLAVAVLIFTGCLVFSFQRSQQRHELELRDVDVSLWIASRAEYQLQRLLNALDRYALGAAGVDHDELVERFEIFWSRLPLLIQGPDSASIQSTATAALVPRLIAKLARLEPEVMALRPGDLAAHERIAAPLRGFAAPLQQLSQEVKAAVGHTSDARRAWQHRLHLEQLGYLFGILVSGGILIGLLFREARQVRRLLADATAARNQIWHLAHHDPLTNLPNRWLFNDRLDQALRRAQRQGEMVALHYFDVDHFKSINDSFGHLTGDRLLVALARRLETCLRDSDTLARIGGDEFAIVQSGFADAAGAELLAERLLAALEPAFTLDGRVLRVSASVGIGLHPDHGADPGQLHHAADQALYRAKAAGRACYRLWQPSEPAREPWRRAAVG